MTNRIQRKIEDHLTVINDFKVLHTGTIQQISNAIIKQLEKNKKVLLCGSGGSSCDAQHFAGELVGRFEKERIGLPAIALTADSCILTAISNDYGYENVFSKQVEALGNKGDVLIALSTSGKSKSVLNAINSAYNKGLIVIFITGLNVQDINYINGNRIESVVDHHMIIPSSNTARVQETTILALHLIANIIEDHFFNKQ